MADRNDIPTAASKPMRRRASDRELLKLCAAWRPAVDHCIAVMDRLDPKPDRDWTAADRALDKEALRAVHRIEERIFDTPAKTLAGLKAKAELLNYMGTTLGAPPTEEHGASLVADILALGRNW